MAVRLFVGNLPYSATEAELREHFSGAGPVSGVWLPLDRETGRPRGFAFVEFEDRSVAEEAVRRFNNQVFGGRPISVNEARPPERSSAPPPRRPVGAGGYGGDRPSAPRDSFGPRSGGPPGPGLGFDVPPEPGADRGRDRSRTFGPDAPRRKGGKKGGRNDKGGDRARGPKKPLQVQTSGRVVWDDDDEHLDDLEALDALDDVSDDDFGEEEGGAEPDPNGTAGTDGGPDDYGRESESNDLDG